MLIIDRLILHGEPARIESVNVGWTTSKGVKVQDSSCFARLTALVLAIHLPEGMAFLAAQDIHIAIPSPWPSPSTASGHRYLCPSITPPRPQARLWLSFLQDWLNP